MVVSWDGAVTVCNLGVMPRRRSIHILGIGKRPRGRLTSRGCGCQFSFSAENKLTAAPLRVLMASVMKTVSRGIERRRCLQVPEVWVSNWKSPSPTRDCHIDCLLVLAHFPLQQKQTMAGDWEKRDTVYPYSLHNQVGRHTTARDRAVDFIPYFVQAGEMAWRGIFPICVWHRLSDCQVT